VLGVILLTVVLPGAIALVVMLLARATPALCRAAPALALGAAGSIGTCLVLGRLPALPGRAGEDWLPLLFLASGLLGAHAAIARRPGISRLLPIALALALLAMPLANAWRAWSIGTIALAWAAGLVILAAPAWALAVLARRERTRHASEWCVIASCLGGGGALLLGYTGKYAQISLILAMVAGGRGADAGDAPDRGQRHDLAQARGLGKRAGGHRTLSCVPGAHGLLLRRPALGGGGAAHARAPWRGAAPGTGHLRGNADRGRSGRRAVGGAVVTHRLL
jgi:hypothetical protein